MNTIVAQYSKERLTQVCYSLSFETRKQSDGDQRHLTNKHGDHGGCFKDTGSSKRLRCRLPHETELFVTSELSPEGDKHTVSLYDMDLDCTYYGEVLVGRPAVREHYCGGSKKLLGLNCYEVQQYT